MTVERTHLRGTWEQARSFSRAVVVRGGRTAYLAGVVDVDAHGGPVTGGAEASCRAVLDRLRDAVEEIGGTLADVVTMTVFLTDVADGDTFVRVREEILAPGPYPAATMVTCTALARPDLRIEVQATVVLDD